MAQIYPFHAYRYSNSAGRLEDLLTQPYDKISPAMQQRYLAASPYNVVRVILGERRDSDTESDNVYTRAAAFFTKWIESGILQREPKPALYPYFQQFKVPDTGETLVRQGFIGLGSVVDYSEHVVYRHEHTLSGPKKDRLQVLRQTGAHFGQIFMLYPGRDGAVDQVLADSMSRQPVCEVTDEYGTIHALGRIDDPARIAEIQNLMRDKKLLIADGHHRYETALNYRNENPGNTAAAAVMMTFVNMYSPGLRILGTHRVVHSLASFVPADLKNALERRFRVTLLKSLAELQEAWAAPHAGQVRIGVSLPGETLLLERPRKGRELDVNILHEELLHQDLGVTPEAVREERYLRYVRGVDPAIKEVEERRAQLAFLLEPPPVEHVAEISFGGGVMPQKSTDFYPKLLTGMAIYRVADSFPGTQKS